MKIAEQYKYIRSVIRSCVNELQLNSCENMIRNFIRNNANNSYYARMFGYRLYKFVDLKRYYYES